MSFALPADEASLEKLLRELFAEHWQDITFGPLIQGAAWEMRAARAPDVIGMMDGYLTIGSAGRISTSASASTGEPSSTPSRPNWRIIAAPSRAELYRRHQPRRHAGLLGTAPLQRQGRAADHRAAPQPVSRPRRQDAENARSGRGSTLWDRLRAQWLGLAGARPARPLRQRFPPRLTASEGRPSCLI